MGLTVYGCTDDEAALFREMAPRLGVRLTITPTPVAEASLDLVEGNRCISIGHTTPLPRATLLELRRAGVEYVSTRSIGDNHIDVESAKSLGMTVGTVAYSPDSVADYTLMLMLMAVRDAQSIVRRADANDFKAGRRRGRELRDLTVGVVGTGRIGTAVIRRLGGFGARVLAHDTKPTRGTDLVPLDELLRRSDIVTLHTPLTEATHHLLDRRRIALMRPDAIVVNTGRGGLLDTEALASALEEGRLGGAALDVLEGEEGIFAKDLSAGPPEHPLLTRLRSLPNVVISPHIAYDTDHSLRDRVENTLANCVSFERERLSWVG